MHAFSYTSGVVVNSLFHFGMCWLLFPLLARLRKNLKLFVVGIVIVSGMQTVYAQISETERFQNAKRSYNAGRLTEAEKQFAEITRDNPENISAQMFLGQTLFREEKYAAAVVPYEKVRSLERSGTKLTLTQHRILNDQLAMAYGITGRSADAKALLQESVRTDPGYPLNYYNLACVSSDENDKAGVLKNLSLAFQHKDQVLPGEQMPDPVSDPSFKKYAQDPDFKALVAKLGRQSN